MYRHFGEHIKTKSFYTVFEIREGQQFIRNPKLYKQDKFNLLTHEKTCCRDRLQQHIARTKSQLNTHTRKCDKDMLTLQHVPATFSCVCA